MQIQPAFAGIKDLGNTPKKALNEAYQYSADNHYSEVGLLRTTNGSLVGLSGIHLYKALNEGLSLIGIVKAVPEPNNPNNMPLMDVNDVKRLLHVKG